MDWPLAIIICVVIILSPAIVFGVWVGGLLFLSWIAERIK